MNIYKTYRNKGFTLIELLVAISIIGLMSTIVLSSVTRARARSQDARRKQDLTQLRSALELYRLDNGFYPPHYPGAWSGVSTGTCGPGNGSTSGVTAYISGLTPNYIRTLPVDPSPPGNCTGYLYMSDGTNYKLLVHGTPDSYPSSGQMFFDRCRPTWSWMICSGEPACGNTAPIAQCAANGYPGNTGW